MLCCTPFRKATLTARRIRQISVLIAAATFTLTAVVVPVGAASTLPNWGQLSPNQSPAGRAYAAMAYDSLRGRTVLFGGGGSTFTNFSDTWEWDGSGWVQKSPVVSPPGLVGAAMAYDSARGVSVLFGGATSSGVDATITWEWNGSNWTPRQIASPPPGRVWTAMAYDSTRHRIVLFGGSGPTGDLGDTWEYDGTNWTQILPVNSPSPRFGTAMAFDSVRGVVVLFGGRASGQRMADTWEWNGTNWTQPPTTSVPYPRFWHSMAFDAQLGQTVVFGGDHIQPYALGPVDDTWLWDGTQWTRDWTAAAPSARAGQSMAYESLTGRAVLFGGTLETFPDVFPTDTWELGAGIVTPPGNPAASFNPTSLGFGAQSIGVTSSPVHILLLSTGTGPLVISSISATGDFAVASTECPIGPNPLAAGAYCFTFVTFTPTAAGARSGSLVFADNTAGGSQSVQLVGTGAGNQANLIVDPATAAFGSTTNVSARLTSNGVPVTGAAVSLTLPNARSATVQTDSKGAALWVSASVAGLYAGSYPAGIQASFAGNQSFFAASGSAALTVTQATPTVTVSATPIAPETSIEFGDQVLISGVVTGAGSPGSAVNGTLSFTFNGTPVGVAQSITTSGASVSVTALLDASTIPSGAGTYAATATFASSDPNYTSASATQTVAVQPERAALTYKGDFYVSDTSSPQLVVVVDQRAAASDAKFIEYAVVPVWVRFEVAGPGGSSTTFARVQDASDWASTGVGVARGSLPALPDGAYSVIATLVDGPGSSAPSRFLAGDDARIGLVSSPTKRGFVSGGGAIASDPSANTNDTHGYFALEMLPGRSIQGNLVYVYRTRMDVGGGSMRDVDIRITSTGITSLSGNQSQATATGRYDVAYVDAQTGLRYSSFEFTGGTFSLNVNDSVTGGSDSFALVLRHSDGSLFHASGPLNADGNAQLAPVAVGDVVTNL